MKTHKNLDITQFFIDGSDNAKTILCAHMDAAFPMDGLITDMELNARAVLHRAYNRIDMEDNNNGIQ